MKQLSPFTSTAFALLFVVGIVGGSRYYANRSATPETYVPGTNAIAVHVVLALLLIVAAVVAELYRRRYNTQSLLLAPFSRPALARFAQTLSLRRGFSILNVLRIPLSLILLFLILWEPYRTGFQIVGGFDPNFTLNAWGGPSYIGAFLAHLLDGTIILYVAAFLLSFVLVRGTTPHTTSKPATLLTR